MGAGDSLEHGISKAKCFAVHNYFEGRVHVVNLDSDDGDLPFGFGSEHLKLADFSVIAFLPPIVHEIIECIGTGRFPQTISLLIIALLDRSQKARHRPLLLDIPKPEDEKSGDN